MWKTAGAQRLNAHTRASPGSSPAAAAATPAPQAEEKKLNIFCWSEYIPQDVIDAFSKETGIQVSVENYASNEEMLAKLLAGGGSYDLIQPSEYAIEGLIAENLLTPIDHALIPNLKNIAPEFLNMSFDRVTSTACRTWLARSASWSIPSS